jgi:hypothetical protein
LLGGRKKFRIGLSHGHLSKFHPHPGCQQDPDANFHFG